MYLSSWIFALITDFEMYSRVTHYKKKIKDYKHLSHWAPVINALRAALGIWRSICPHPLSWWSCESEMSLTENDKKEFYICIKYVHVELHYNTKKRTELIKCTGTLQLILADRTNLWLGYIRLILTQCCISGQKSLRTLSNPGIKGAQKITCLWN